MSLRRGFHPCRWVAPVALIFGLMPSCSEPSSSPSAGSETHFLMDCDASCDATVAST